ncbi:hypothetical protein [Cyclobacterium sp.]|uniref:hypothetical protein n=1 Tax=Cyclobacterium sp. TaxID=1966343 RepID=UPI0025C286AA|nr:hypothetical protein [Cyclobacterium sp.]
MTPSLIRQTDAVWAFQPLNDRPSKNVSEGILDGEHVQSKDAKKTTSKHSTVR